MQNQNFIMTPSNPVKQKQFLMKTSSNPPPGLEKPFPFGFHNINPRQVDIILPIGEYDNLENAESFKTPQIKTITSSPQKLDQKIIKQEMISKTPSQKTKKSLKIQSEVFNQMNTEVFKQKNTTSQNLDQYNLIQNKIFEKNNIIQYASSPKKNDQIDIAQKIEKSKQIQQQYQIKENRYKLFETQLKDNLIIFSKDKYFHHIIILVLTIGPVGQKEWIYERVLENKNELYIDQYGYKIFVLCMESSKLESNLHYKQFVDLLLNDNNKNQQLQLSINKYGNYIIQKCIQLFEDEHFHLLLINLRKYILPIQDIGYKIQIEFMHDLCFDQSGCLVIQKLIEEYNLKKNIHVANKKIIGQIIDKIVINGLFLSQKPYSNYIIQQIIEKGSRQHKESLQNMILVPHFVELTLDKFGSNVIERSLIFSEQQYINKVWKQLECNNHNWFYNIVNDNYGNYVVQKLYEISESEIQKAMFHMINFWKQQNKLKDHGNHVYNFILMNQEYNKPNIINNQLEYDIYNIQQNNLPQIINQKNQNFQFNNILTQLSPLNFLQKNLLNSSNEIEKQKL